VNEKVYFSIWLSSIGFAFALNPQTATKRRVNCKVKGVGKAKAEAIIEYRKKHTLKTKDDLIQVKGIGDVIADNILKDVLNDKKKKKV